MTQQTNESGMFSWMPVLYLSWRLRPGRAVRSDQMSALLWCFSEKGTLLKDFGKTVSPGFSGDTVFLSDIPYSPACA